MGRYFVGNFIGNDATTENYLSVSGGVDRAQNSESLYLEKTISYDRIVPALGWMPFK